MEIGKINPSKLVELTRTFKGKTISLKLAQ